MTKAPPHGTSKALISQLIKIFISKLMGMKLHLLGKTGCCQPGNYSIFNPFLTAATPMHLPHLIGPFQHYLWILKTCHAGADMDVALAMARGSLDGDLAWNLTDLLQNRNEWWVPGKLVDLRGRLAGYWKVRCRFARLSARIHGFRSNYVAQF